MRVDTIAHGVWMELRHFTLGTKVSHTSKWSDICVPPSNFITNYSNFIKNVLKIYHLSRVNVFFL